MGKVSETYDMLALLKRLEQLTGIGADTFQLIDNSNP
jgi:hypothetical protein